MHIYFLYLLIVATVMTASLAEYIGWGVVFTTTTMSTTYLNYLIYRHMIVVNNNE